MKYDSDEMLDWLKQHFEQKGYQVQLYSEELLPARVPLYCVKEEHGSERNEIIIEFTTDKIITKKDFFPTLNIPSKNTPTEPPLEISEVSSVSFYQYYFPKSKVFFAYPDYAQENAHFESFKKVCEKKGVGLLKTSETTIEETLAARSLFAEICNELIENAEKPHNIRSIVGDLMENVLHYLVYYPNPVYKRRAIAGETEKGKKRLSFSLMDKIGKLKKVAYKNDLKPLADYRQKDKDDYDLAKDCIGQLWKKRLGLNYPDIQISIENILQRDNVYREHFVHQFQVFLIGIYILDCIYKEVSEEFKKTFGSGIEDVWLAASTFHDFSYGLQNFDTWLMQFFEDTLRVRCKQTKESLNFLNLDAAMIREELFEQISKIASQLNGNERQENKRKTIRFFYEKAVRDRNHGVLSGISLLKLYEEANLKEVKMEENAILEAATAIACHDEDIWESLCGCQGYRRSARSLPKDETACNNKCQRNGLLWSAKKSRIYKEKIADGTFLKKQSCESWERDIMVERIIDKIKFSKQPILFLLIFCDSIQDEGRVTSSAEGIHKDRSFLVDIIVEDQDRSTKVKIESNQAEKKEDEIERIAWCLQDDKFGVCINEKSIIMNGSGGGG